MSINLHEYKVGVLHHSLLPEWAQDKLKEAARVPVSENGRERTRAVDKVFVELVRRIPMHFRRECVAEVSGAAKATA